jgi:membrane protease YdiL (CAAX protease family)
MPTAETPTLSDLAPRLWLVGAVLACLPATAVAAWRVVRWWLSGRPFPLPRDGAWPLVPWPAWFGLLLFGGIFSLMFLLSNLCAVLAELGFLPWKPFTGQDLANPGLLLSQLLPSALGLWLVTRLGPGAVKTIGVRAGRPARDVLYGLGMTAVVIPVCIGAMLVGALVLWLFGLPTVSHPVLVSINESSSLGTLAAALVLASVVAPLAEEFTYRGVLMTSLLKPLGAAGAIAASSTIFALVHILVEPQAILALFVLGAALGYVTYRTRSLVAAVVAHSAFNTLMVLGTFFGGPS